MSVTTEAHPPQYYLDYLLQCIQKYCQKEIKLKEYSIAWADYWRYYIGVNVIPAVGRAKVPVKGCLWRLYQNAPISQEQHEEWKNSGSFVNGNAIIVGKVWHRPDLAGYYLAGIDADNLIAMEELLTNPDSGVAMTLEQFSQITLVEQHDDVEHKKDRMHYYVYTVGKQLKDKTSDIGKPGIDPNTTPAFEIKASSKFLMYCSPNIHKNGYALKPLGTFTPVRLFDNKIDEHQKHLDSICRKYGLNSNGSAKVTNDDNNTQIPVQELFKEDCKIYKGNNRHLAILRVMDSLLRRNNGILSLEQIGQLARQWNDKHCEPPLDDNDFGRQWNDAQRYVAEKLQRDRAGNGDAREGKGKTRKRKNVGGTDESKDDEEETNDVDTIREFIIELFKDQFGRSYATVDINGHYEPLLVHQNSEKFKIWASFAYNRKVGKPLQSEHLTQACNILQGEACIFGDKEKKLDLRVSSGLDSQCGNMTFWYDLANKTRQVIKITQDEWSIKESKDAPIMFRRYPQTKAQVTPTRNYPPDIFDQFMRLINIKITDKDGKEDVDQTRSLILLVKCYIVSLFVPDIPQTILMLYGPQGTAKTSSEESIKDLVDPSPIPTLALPRDIVQLQQQLSHNYLPYYDNVSYITGEQSDQLCRASTGSGSSKRMLYSDDDDVLYWYIRGVGISAINIVATRPDLLDRGILAPCAPINEIEFKSMEYYIKAQRRRIIPQLLGYIFDILVKVIRIKNNGGIKINTKSRMVDFCEYGEIISRCMGYTDGSFTNAYSENIKRITNAALDSGIVAQVIVRFMDDKTEWDGSPSELYQFLELIANGDMKIDTRYIKEWPKSASVLSRKLNEYKASLSKMDIHVDRYTLNYHTGQTGIRIRKFIPPNRDESMSKPSESSVPYARQLDKNKDGMQEYDLRNAADDSTMSFTNNPCNCLQNMSAYDADDPDDLLRNSIYNKLTIDEIARMQDNKTFRLVKAIVYGQKKKGNGPIGIYRASQNSDRWNCNVCNQKGDIFSSIAHIPACLTRYNN